MYDGAKARWAIYAMLLGGLAALLYGLWGLRGTAIFRYVPFLGALAAGATPTPAATVAQLASTPGPPAREQIVALVQGYNQADVLTNRTNDLAALLPYLHPDGPLYASLSASFRRRIAAGEVRNVQLTRFWAAEPVVSAEEITVETREIWDVTILDRAGQVQSSRVGIMTRQRYTIRRDAGGAWRIWDLETAVEGDYAP